MKLKNLTDEKPKNIISAPIIPYRKVLDSIVFVLRTGCLWKILPKEYRSGSTFHRRFHEWRQSSIFDK